MVTNSDQQSLAYTGERMVPGVADKNTFWEHVARYRFACGYVKGRDVVDIACGEGYGSAGLLLGGARSLIGIDVAEEAVKHAIKKYRIDARIGSAEAIPLQNESADVVVSFETIEHVPDPQKFVSEAFRILRPGGLFIVSTPNATIYQERISENPFHCSELSVTEFCDLLKKHSKSFSVYGQTGPRPWYVRLRGVPRLARKVQHAAALGIFSDTNRDAEAAEILCSRKTSALERFWSSDAVKHFDSEALNQCMYCVAVAIK